MSETLKHKAVKSVLWKILETGGMQLVQITVSVVLARYVMPSQYGAIAMLTIFLVIAQTFIDSGFSAALIRKNTRTQIDCSTVFYFNIAISIIAYLILYFIAPFVSDFYNMPILTPVLRVSSLSLIISGFSAVQSALFRAQMDFKALAKFNVTGAIVSGVIGIIMAIYDFQVWALVAQSLTSVTFNSMCLWIKSKWRPSLNFSFTSLREFFGFGSKLLASGLLDTTFNNVYGVLIGKFYSASDLAFYNRAYSLNNMTSIVPTNILQSVTYPTLCKLQTENERLRIAYRKILRICAFVIFPICLGIGAISYPLINIMYTDRWIYAASLLQIVVFSGMWYPIHAVNLNLLMVKGRTDLFLRLEIIKKSIIIVIICITVPIGIKAICYGSIISSILCLFVNTHYTGKLLNMGFLQQMRDYLPFLSLSVFMFIVCKLITNILGNGWISLIIGILTGVIIYGGLAFIFRFPELKEIKNIKK